MKHPKPNENVTVTIEMPRMVRLKLDEVRLARAHRSGGLSPALKTVVVEALQALIARVELSPQAWQTAAILVNLPSYNYISALLLAELHGRMGYFPPVIRMKPVENALPPRFEVAEIINLQAIRDAARKERF